MFAVGMLFSAVWMLAIVVPAWPSAVLILLMMFCSVAVMPLMKPPGMD